MPYRCKKNALSSEIVDLSNFDNDEVCIPSLSSILLAVCNKLSIL